MRVNSSILTVAATETLNNFSVVTFYTHTYYEYVYLQIFKILDTLTEDGVIIVESYFQDRS